MITYQPHQLYLILNYVTKAGHYFEPLEVLAYHGHQVVYGELRQDAVRVWHSSIELPEQPTAFAVPNVTDKRGLAAMAMLISETHGDQGTGRLFGQLRIYPRQVSSDLQAHPIKRLLTATENPATPHPDHVVMTIGQDIAAMWKGTRYIEGWVGKNPNRQGLLRCGIRTLDLYEDIIRLGQLPTWFVNQRRDYLNRLQGRYN